MATPQFDIQILLDHDQPQQLVVGDDLQLTCQIPEDSPYANPVWYTPDSQRVFAIGQGKDLNHCLGYLTLTYPGSGFAVMPCIAYLLCGTEKSLGPKSRHSLLSL